MSQHYPSWLERWRLLAINNPQIELFEEEEALAHKERLLSLYEKQGPAGVLLTEQPLELCQQLIGMLVPLAKGPPFPSRIEGVSHRPWLWIRENQPEQILVSLHELMPPILWFSVGQEVAELYKALDERIEEDVPSRYEMSKTHRAFLGTTALLDANMDTLVGHFSLNPFVESLFWGSAHDDDPWPFVIDIQDADVWTEDASEQMGQDPQALPSLSMRTTISRSIITIETHLDDVFVAQVSYDPGQDQGQVEALNMQFGAHYPLDMPLDVVAALLGFYFEGELALSRMVLEAYDEEEMAFYVLLLSCVAHGELSFVERLRPFLGHQLKPVRLAAAQMAATKQMPALAWARLFKERERDVRAQILEHLLSSSVEAS